MSETLDVDEGDAPPAAKAAAPKAKPVQPKADPPGPDASALAHVNGANPELYLVSGLMLGPEDMPRAAHLPAEAFEDPEARSIYGALRGGLDWPNDLFKIEKLTKVPRGRLLDISNLLPTSLQTVHFIEEVEAAWRARRFKAMALQMASSDDPDPLAWAARIAELGNTRSRLAGLKPSEFKVPLPGDPSILLGNRYLVRGDGCILVSTSGMGKSSMLLMMAYLWALGRPFFGVKPNGPLRILIVQSEDSDGDIAEVCVSIAAMLKLTPEEQAQVDERVLVITDRIHRGPAFVSELAVHERQFKPDLVMLNPLKAFFKGDLNSGEDAGDFLREGLNGLNTPPRFAYLIVHHAAKPPNSKEVKDRKWSEVMYDMTGSAELTDWSRAVISLRAADKEGEFNLVFAKRGRRAGATVITGEADQYEEVGTSVPLKHTSAMVTPPGHKEAIPAIFWERRLLTDDEKAAKKKGAGGRPKKHHFEKFAPAFPTDPLKAIGINALMREIISKGYGAISKGALDKLIDESVDEGFICRVSRDDPRYFLKPKAPA
jgi:hypothetical protein